jgi:phosphate-selective porin OprO/OprP
MRAGVRRLLSALVCAAGVTLLAAGPGRADDNKLLMELKERLEKLEKQNEELRQALEGLQQKVAPAAPEPAPAKPPAEAEIKQVVGDYLKEQEQKKAQDAEAKKKEHEEAGWEIGKDLGMKVQWRNGLVAETEDKAFRVWVGGRLQTDAVWLQANDDVMFAEGGTGPLDDAVNFRRARLDVDARMWEVIEIYTQYDFLNTFNVGDREHPRVINVPAPTDLWATFERLPVIGNLRVGNQKPPISLEHLTSSRFLDFLERSLAFDAFIEDGNNGFEPGIQAFNWFPGQRASWAVGVFRHNRNVFGWNTGDGETEVCGRLVGLPVYEHDGRCLVHLGLGGRYRDPDDHISRFRSRILVRNGPAALHTIIAETREVLSESEAMLVPEFLMILGPFQLQAEYYASWINGAVTPVEPVEERVPRGQLFYQGAYVEVLYFLTGEHRPYNRVAREYHRQATPDRIIPIENFFWVDSKRGWLFGRGAWQVAARYSYLDLINKGVGTAVLNDVTLGLNWFLNPNMKVQWNYSVVHRQAAHPEANGVIQAFGTRLAFDF